MAWYRCEGCGCRLDPGEGHYCEECLEKYEQEDDDLHAAAERDYQSKDLAVTYG